MRKRMLLLAAVTIAALVWTFSPLDGETTVALARVLYAECSGQSAETTRVYGETILNRVGRDPFGQTLAAVLRQGYPSGSRYDGRTLDAARRLVRAQVRETPADVVWAVPALADQARWEHLRFWRFQGAFALYTDEPASGAAQDVNK